MAVTHNGQAPAKLKQFMNPNDRDTFYEVWDEALEDTNETIVSSEWILPDGFTLISEQVDISITQKGTTYLHANSAIIEVDSDNITLGEYLFANEIVTETRRLRRNTEVEVKEI